MPDRVEKLGELLRDVHRGLLEATKSIIQEHGLSPQWMRVMHHVMGHPGTTVSEIARERGFAKSHISHGVDLMVETGLVEKRPDESDQRLVRLYPTPEAKGHFEAMHARIHARMAEVLAVLSKEQVDGVLESLTLLRTALQSEASQPDRS